MRNAPLKARRRFGFTLIELMIAVVVVAILAAIAYPSYAEYLRKSRRADAKLLLTLAGERLERCFAECNSYTAPACGAPCPVLPMSSSEGYYRIDTGPINATSWTLVAKPVAGKSQASDAACTSFTMTSQGTKSATGTAAAKCWE
jgi:type IV pilus assembly protein PilE